MVTTAIKIQLSNYETFLEIKAEFPSGDDRAHEKQVASMVQAAIFTALGNIQQLPGGVTRATQTYIIPVTMPEAVDARSKPETVELPPTAMPPTGDDTPDFECVAKADDGH